MKIDNENRCCDNCKRRGSDIRLTSYGRDRYCRANRLTYYSIPRTLPFAFLCSSCDHYIIEKSKSASDYWPAMVYMFLKHENSPNVLSVSFEERWKVIPQTWRAWWEQEFANKLDGQEECLFVDRTIELEQLEAALSDNNWLPLARQIDQHVAYPEV